MSDPAVRPLSMRLEVVVIPVADVDRSMRFYTSLGWRLDADVVKGDAFRLVQFTPPGSKCSIHIGKGVTSAPSGSQGSLYLIVDDIVAAREELIRMGAPVSEVFHRTPGEPDRRGPDPQGRTYASFVSFPDPDGNRWLVQEVKVRLPGRDDADTALEQARAPVPA